MNSPVAALAVAATSVPPRADVQHDSDAPLASCISLDEQLLTLTEAAKHLPHVDGRKVAISTIWRWCRQGLRGIRLEYVRIGRKVCTTREAMLRFFGDLADRDRRVPPDTRAIPRKPTRRPITSLRRQRELARVDAVLRRAGLGDDR